VVEVGGGGGEREVMKGRVGGEWGRGLSGREVRQGVGLGRFRVGCTEDVWGESHRADK
jgi:hypothetical protein